MQSKHVIGPDRPLAQAVDLAPVPLDWKDIPAFEQLGKDVQTAADELGIAIVWGGTWTHLRDYPHFQLAD